MKWKLKALTIWCLAVPAFTGLFLDYIPGNLLAGVSYGWLVYGTIVYAVIILLLGKKICKVTIVIGLTIAIPLVFLGTLISSIGIWLSGWDPARLADTSTHYIRLLVTMMVVIPLALSMVAVLPFHRLEQHILQSRRGVRISEKIVLMFLRVFSHIFYFVLPSILEVIREEGMLTKDRVLTGGNDRGRVPWTRRLGEIIQVLVNIGVESICSSIRYVPLWADEISRLPGYDEKRQKPDTTESSEN